MHAELKYANVRHGADLLDGQVVEQGHALGRIMFHHISADDEKSETVDHKKGKRKGVFFFSFLVE